MHNCFVLRGHDLSPDASSVALSVGSATVATGRCFSKQQTKDASGFRNFV